ncbi:hypothetical protein [Micromonospora sp. NPDC004704]
MVLDLPARGFGVYVQVKQIGDADLTDEILAGLRLSNSLAPQAIPCARRSLAHGSPSP